MKKNSGKSAIAFLSFCLFIASNSFSQNFKWANSFGDPSNTDQGKSITVDGAGNVYTLGEYYGTVDFDPGAGTTNLTSVGQGDIYITKSDAAGNLIWAKSIGGSGDDGASGIAIDNSGNVFITGNFYATVDFDPSGGGVFYLTSNGNTDIFVEKLDPSGNYIWAAAMGGANYDSGTSLGTDPFGNVIVTGNFFGTVDFDPLGGITNLSSTGGSEDFFILKLDPSENFIWAENSGGIGTEESFALKTDLSGSIYITGSFQGTADFDPGVGNDSLTSAAGSSDVFVLKLDQNGNELWAKGMGGSGVDIGCGISVDAGDNVLTTGYYNGTGDFDPSAGIFTLTSNGVEDFFISKLDAIGNFMWAKSIGGTGTENSFSIATDPLGNVYSLGYFSGTVDFDPGAGSVLLNSFGGSGDFFISKLDATGNFVWASVTGGTGSDVGNSIAIDTSENIYVTGYYSGLADFDPQSGTHYLNSAGGSNDAFILKWDQCGLAAQAGLDQTICSGDDATFNASSSGGNLPLTYSWYDGSLTFTNPTLIEGPITNTILSLTITDSHGCVSTDTAFLAVTPSTNIYGHVNYSGGALANGGNVVMYQQLPFLGYLDTLQITTLNSTGDYQFSAINHQNYLIEVFPDTTLFPTTVPTFNGNVYLWDSSTVLVHDCALADTVNITMVEKSTISGIGMFMGHVYQDVGFMGMQSDGGFARSPGDPVPGIDVKIGRNPGGQMVTNTQTNGTGQYTFTNLPFNTGGQHYTIYVDIPGLHRDSTYEFVVDAANNQFVNLDYYADSTSVYPIMGSATSSAITHSLENEFSVYPNPSKGNATVEYTINSDAQVTLGIYNVLGIKVAELVNTKESAGTYKVNVNSKNNNLSNGVYFISLITNGKTNIHKIIISE